jgi:hypothetical protein
VASYRVDIAEAVKDSLDGASLSLAFTPTRKWLPEFRRSEMDTLHVTVVPAGSDPATSISRNTQQNDELVHVSVQKQVDPETFDDDCDALDAFVQEIKGHLWAKARKMSGAKLISIANNPAADLEHLKQNQYTSVLVLTYRKLA